MDAQRRDGAPLTADFVPRCGMMAQDFWKLQKLLFLNGGPKVSCDLVSRAACAPNPGVLFFLFVLPLGLAPPPPATGKCLLGVPAFLHC